MDTTKTAVDRPSALWLAMSWYVMDHIRDSEVRITARIDMPFSRYRALRRLERKSWSQRDLAADMRIDGSAMTGIVADLVDRGFAERTPNPDDGRSKLVTISPEGRAVLHALRSDPGVAPPEFHNLDDHERTALATLLRRLRDEEPTE